MAQLFSLGIMHTQITDAIEKAKLTLKESDSFCVDGHWYGIRRLFAMSDWQERKFGERVFSMFAEDSCGNEFLADDARAVFFWDHETDDIIPLSDSLLTFLSSLVRFPEVHLKPGQVKRVWGDPNFKPTFD